MPEPYETFRYEVAGAVATLTIDNPAKRNALTMGTFGEMRDALARAKADAAVRVIVLTGAGEQAFSAGADLSGMVGTASHLDLHEARGELGRFIGDIWSVGKPTIAKVRGYCLAGGFGVALSCDIVVAAADAVFGTPEIDVGIWPMMITVPLIRAMPPKKALELMMTGRRVSAEEGERLGVREPRRAGRVSGRRGGRAGCDAGGEVTGRHAARARPRSTTCSTWMCVTRCRSCRLGSRSSRGPTMRPRASTRSRRSADPSGRAVDDGSPAGAGCECRVRRRLGLSLNGTSGATRVGLGPSRACHPATGPATHLR